MLCSTTTAQIPASEYGLPGTRVEENSDTQPSSEGGDISPVVILPENTRVSLVDDKGQYSHGFSDKEGTQVSEQGSLLSTNDGWEYVIVKKGFYSYKSPEGRIIRVNYIADENGFHVLDDSQL
ncbi:hypothetical protein J6590_065350 [Homalodisca vitripennis]|nr:hypothetical protein J6590_065350 [Homalodisca vitripennis]